MDTMDALDIIESIDFTADIAPKLDLEPDENGRVKGLFLALRGEAPYDSRLIGSTASKAFFGRLLDVAEQIEPGSRSMVAEAIRGGLTSAEQVDTSPWFEFKWLILDLDEVA